MLRLAPLAVIVGHSEGGAAAVSFALDHPERVRALHLIAPGISDYPWPDDAYFVEYEALFTCGDPEALVALGLRTWAAAGADPAVADQVRRGVDGYTDASATGSRTWSSDSRSGSTNRLQARSNRTSMS